jgi:hypothetical protein
MAPSLFVLAVAISVPTMDLPRICQSERSGVPADQQESVYQGCLRDEQAARDKLTKEWPQYPAEARATCAQLGRQVFSYVEVLTCIEIKTGYNALNGTTPAQPSAPPPAPSQPGSPQSKTQP